MSGESTATPEAEPGTSEAPPATEAPETPKPEAKPTNGDATPAAADEAPAGPEAGLPSWRDGIPDDLKKSAEQFTSPTALLKSYAQLRNQFNKSLQPLPEKPTDEQVAAFRKKQGIPEAADGYGIEAPDWFDDQGKENLTDFLTKAHESNMTPAQVKQAVDAYAGYEQARAEKIIADINADTEANVKVLKDEWGVDFDANVAVAARAVAHFGGQELGEDLNALKLDGGGMLASNPAFIKLMAEVGRAASEPTGVHVPLVSNEQTKKELNDEANELISSPDYYSNQKSLTRVREIFDLLEGKAHHSGPSSTAAVR
ncbi:MAG: hypothetical protein ACR2QF_03025 [Geminicoccaceae bacterium]